jgi:hypothetical protein
MMTNWSGENSGLLCVLVVDFVCAYRKADRKD